MDKKAKRVIGFYEVKMKNVNVRIVAELKSNGFYYICGMSSGYFEIDFDYISDSPIISESK